MKQSGGAQKKRWVDFASATIVIALAVSIEVWEAERSPPVLPTTPEDMITPETKRDIERVAFKAEQRSMSVA